MCRASFSLPVAVAVSLSGLIGVVIGALVPLDQFWSRSTTPWIRTLQDLLAYDFYTPEIYRRTVVSLVANLAQFTRWVELNVIKSLADGVGNLSMATANDLKLSVSGKTQSYVLTVLFAIVLLLGVLQIGRGG